MTGDIDEEGITHSGCSARGLAGGIWSAGKCGAGSCSGTGAVAAAPAAPANPLGTSTFNKVCAMCHAAGVAGAPKPGDKADWGRRIAQGKDVLYKRALEGFTGAKGMMPARGGGSTLTDEEVKAAVDHMVAKSS